MLVEGFQGHGTTRNFCLCPYDHEPSVGSKNLAGVICQWGKKKPEYFDR